MFMLHLILGIVTGILSISNLVFMIIYARKYPLVIIYNGFAAAVCAFAAFFNLSPIFF